MRHNRAVLINYKSKFNNNIKSMTKTKEAIALAKAAEKAAAEALDPERAERADQSEPKTEEVGAFKAVYRELTVEGTRKGSIAYKTFETKKAAEKFVEETGGKLV